MIWVPFLETSIYLLMSHKHNHIYYVINIYGRSLLMVFVRDRYEDFPMPCLIEGRLYDLYHPWYIMLYWLYLVYVGIIYVYIERYTCWVILVVSKSRHMYTIWIPWMMKQENPQGPTNFGSSTNRPFVSTIVKPLQQRLSNIYQPHYQPWIHWYPWSLSHHYVTILVRRFPGHAFQLGATVRSIQIRAGRHGVEVGRGSRPFRRRPGGAVSVDGALVEKFLMDLNMAWKGQNPQVRKESVQRDWLGRGAGGCGLCRVVPKLTWTHGPEGFGF
jgi:hypothetical protein